MLHAKNPHPEQGPGNVIEIVRLLFSRASDTLAAQPLSLSIFALPNGVASFPLFLFNLCSEAKSKPSAGPDRPASRQRQRLPGCFMSPLPLQSAPGPPWCVQA